MLKIEQISPKLYRCILYVVFHKLEPQNVGLVDVKRDLNFYARKFKKTSIVIKNVIWSEKTMMHKAERPSNKFFQFFHI